MTHPQIHLWVLLSTMLKHHLSLVFFRKDSQASVSPSGGSNSRRNSELEMQHQASLNEADMENRRQKKSLRQFQRRNTLNTSTEETIPEDEAGQRSPKNTKL